MIETQQLNDAIKLALGDLLSMFSIEYKLLDEKDEEKLKSSDEEINVILGLAGEIKGTIVVGFSKNIVLKIVSGMMGGMEMTELDEMAISGISEFVNMLGGSAVTKIETTSFVDITPPTVITSCGNTTIINQLKTHKIIYSVADEKLMITYCIKKAE